MNAASQAITVGSTRSGCRAVLMLGGSDGSVEAPCLQTAAPTSKVRYLKVRQATQSSPVPSIQIDRNASISIEMHPYPSTSGSIWRATKDAQCGREGGLEGQGLVCRRIGRTGATTRGASIKPSLQRKGGFDMSSILCNDHSTPTKTFRVRYCCITL